jgi:hypothetical protein
MADPAIPQLSSVTSESLQATIRRLLPSQQGFGVELAATNVITPIIDLTPTAEGSSVPSFLQRAVAFGSQTAFDLSNATTTLINNTGFWQIRGAIVTSSETTNNPNVAINITDGLTTKQIYELRDFNSGADSMVVDYQEVVFLRTGESLSAAVSAYAAFMGSYRQIADVNGNLVNPVGFTPQ